MTITLNNLISNSTPIYNGIYPQRPVWGIIATTNSAAPSATNNFFYTFGEKQPFAPMTMDFGPGSSQANIGMGRARIQNQDEVATSGYYFCGSTSASSVSTSSASPTSGYVGCSMVGQTGANFYFEARDSGHWGFENTSYRSTVFRHSGVVVGEANWNQTYDLIAYNGKIMKLPLNSYSAFVTTPAANPDFFYASSQLNTNVYGNPTGASAGIGNAAMTSDAATIGSAYTNYGMICHNRNNGKLAYLEATTTNGRYRLHIIDLRNKIGQDTTTREIYTWINEAVAAGTSRYNNFTINLPSWSNSYSVSQSYALKPILCDDGTMWIVGWDKNDSSTGGTNRLYRCTDTAAYATWTQVSSTATTTTYAMNQGEFYGVRHLNSDDNSRVAVYNQYYYYLGGINCYIVDTKTAVTSGSDVKWMLFAQQDSSYAYIPAPVGGKGFVMGCPNPNADGGAGAQLMYFNTEVLAGQTISYSANIYGMPTINQSTSYSSWMPLKIQPTREWKPTY